MSKMLRKIIIDDIECVSIKDLMNYLEVSYTTLYDYLSRNNIGFEIVGKSRVYHLFECDELINYFNLKKSYLSSKNKDIE